MVLSSLASETLALALLVAIGAGNAWNCGDASCVVPATPSAQPGDASEASVRTAAQCYTSCVERVSAVTFIAARTSNKQNAACTCLWLQWLSRFCLHNCTCKLIYVFCLFTALMQYRNFIRYVLSWLVVVLALNSYRVSLHSLRRI